MPQKPSSRNPQDYQRVAKSHPGYAARHYQLKSNPQEVIAQRQYATLRQGGIPYEKLEKTRQIAELRAKKDGKALANKTGKPVLVQIKSTLRTTTPQTSPLKPKASYKGYITLYQLAMNKQRAEQGLPPMSRNDVRTDADFKRYYHSIKTYNPKRSNRKYDGPMGQALVAMGLRAEDNYADIGDTP